VQADGLTDHFDLGSILLPAPYAVLPSSQAASDVCRSVRESRSLEFEANGQCDLGAHEHIVTIGPPEHSYDVVICACEGSVYSADRLAEAVSRIPSFLLKSVKSAPQTAAKRLCSSVVLDLAASCEPVST
jgi:hypothetical protein